MSSEARAREEICAVGASLFARGLTFGSTGNISVRLEDGGWLMTPTNASLGALDPARLSRFDAEGRLTDGDPPTKESFLHIVMYDRRDDCRAVVHLHSTHSVAVSVLDGLDPDDVLPPLTAYFVMRVGRLPLIPYFAPGDKELAAAVGALGRQASRGAARQPRPRGGGIEPRQCAIRDRGIGGDREAVSAASRPQDSPAHPRPGRGTSLSVQALG